MSKIKSPQLQEKLTEAISTICADLVIMDDLLMGEFCNEGVS